MGGRDWRLGGGPGACWPRHTHLKGGGGMVHCGLQPGERAKGPRTLESRGASQPFVTQRRWEGGQTGEEIVYIQTGDMQGTSEKRWLGVRGGGGGLWGGWWTAGRMGHGWDQHEQLCDMGQGLGYTGTWGERQGLPMEMGHGSWDVPCTHGCHPRWHRQRAFSQQWNSTQDGGRVGGQGL